MARRSSRLSTADEGETKHKRSASKTELSQELPKRPRKQGGTPVKSQYFTASADKDKENNLKDLDDEADDLESPEENSASEFDDGDDDQDDDVDPPPSDSNESEDEEYESDDQPKRRKTGKQNKGTTSSVNTSRASELWRPGVKTGLGPGKQVIIKKPKARAAGKTPYRDETIHPNTFLFLEDLKANNNREWLKMNDPDFRASERDWYGFVEKMTQKLIEIDDTIPELPVKDVIFRIYRDVRFSKDPTPYKPMFSVNWSRSGRKGGYASYYLQVTPKNSFIGGGIWMPETERLDALRREVDRNPQRIREVLSDVRLSNAFFDISKKNSQKVIKAFAKGNAENALKTKPKGYAADHPDIELMRLKTFIVGRKLEDHEVLGEAGVHRIAELLSCMKPFITYLNSIVMPDDPEPEHDSSDDEDDAEGASEDEDIDSADDDQNDE